LITNTKFCHLAHAQTKQMRKLNLFNVKMNQGSLINLLVLIIVIILRKPGL